MLSKTSKSTKKTLLEQKVYKQENKTLMRINNVLRKEGMINYFGKKHEGREIMECDVDEEDLRTKKLLKVPIPNMFYMDIWLFSPKKSRYTEVLRVIQSFQVEYIYNIIFHSLRRSRTVDFSPYLVPLIKILPKAVNKCSFSKLKFTEKQQILVFKNIKCKDSHICWMLSAKFHGKVWPKN
ncbi:unnamed protein product [Moneuplotes crassus]|uniref:Uncharacterized protein n=1 Tax=Euplotes crassus TaxID=5936 RepID=A0AAD1XSX4_EUPCR|nr:unnamed protein product [Moneuplotes crassus]